jgi:hypothetical protein
VQTVVLTARNDPAPIENQDLICIADGALSMGDHDARARQRVQILLHGLFGILVQVIKKGIDEVLKRAEWSSFRSVCIHVVSPYPA